MTTDSNPNINPYIYANKISPHNTIDYVDRNQQAIRMPTAGSKIYKIFKKYGWLWVGDWDQLKDYQHFEKIID